MAEPMGDGPRHPHLAPSRSGAVHGSPRTLGLLPRQSPPRPDGRGGRAAAAGGPEVIRAALSAVSGAGPSAMGGAGGEAALARTLITAAGNRQARGRHTEAGALLARAAGHAAHLAAAPEETVAAGLLAVSLWRGPEPASAAVERVRELLTAHGEDRPALRLVVDCALAVLFGMRERHAEAAARIAAARRVAAEPIHPGGAVLVPLAAAEVASLAGDTGRALALLDEAEEAETASGGGVPGALVARRAARLLLDSGRTAQAARRLAAAGALPGAEAAADLGGLLARAAAAQGRRAAAVAAAEGAVAAARATDSPAAEGLARLDAARALLGCGLLTEARRAAALAGRSFALKGHLPGAARAEDLHARAMARRARGGHPAGGDVRRG